MATSLAATINVTGGGSYQNNLDLTAPVDRLVIGSGTSGSQGVTAIKYSVTNGTGSNNSDLWFHDQRSVNTGSTDNLDLAGSLTNAFGTTLTFVEIRFLLIRIISPDGTKSLRIGPQNVSNAWPGPWGGSGATVYLEIEDTFIFYSHYDGGLGTVTATTGDIFPIANQSGSNLTYDIWIIGVSA